MLSAGTFLLFASIATIVSLLLTSDRKNSRWFIIFYYTKKSFWNTFYLVLRMEATTEVLNAQRRENGQMCLSAYRVRCGNELFLAEEMSTGNRKRVINTSHPFSQTFLPNIQFIIIPLDIRCPPFETNANETKLTEQFPFSRILECPEGLTFKSGLRTRLLECVRPNKWNTDDVMCQRK